MSWSFHERDDQQRVQYRCEVCGALSKFTTRAPETLRHKCPTPKHEPFYERCVHRGEATGDKHLCELCGWRTTYRKVYVCAIHGVCTLKRWTMLSSKNPEQICIICPDLKEK